MTKSIARISTLCLGGALLALPAQGGSAGMPLAEVFQAALKIADTVTIDSEIIQQAQEVENQAHSAMLPNIAASASATRQKQVQNGLGASIAPAYQPLTKITATQPLFLGFKDFAALRQTRELLGAVKLDRDAAVVQLYKDVSTQFFTITAAEKDLANVVTELGFYDRRIKELQKFQRIGRSQVTDVLTAQTAKASLVATQMQLRGQIEAARQVLHVMTGLDQNVPLAVTVDDNLPRDFGSLPSYLAQIDQRPEIQAGLTRTHSANEGIQIARAGHLPTVTLSGDYYLQRAGAQKDITWDVTLGVTVPIYSGGLVVSQVDQAVSVKRQSDDTVTQLRHLAEQEIRGDYATMQADKEQLDALKIATDLAKRNYEAETKNYRLGLVTNLDVLTALTSFQEDQRALDRQRYALALDNEKLAAAVARRPVGFTLSTPKTMQAATQVDQLWVPAMEPAM